MAQQSRVQAGAGDLQHFSGDKSCAKHACDVSRFDIHPVSELLYSLGPATIHAAQYQDDDRDFDYRFLCNHRGCDAKSLLAGDEQQPWPLCRAYHNKLHCNGQMRGLRQFKSAGRCILGWFFQCIRLYIYPSDYRHLPGDSWNGYVPGIVRALFQRAALGQMDHYGYAAGRLFHAGCSDMDI